MTYTKKQFLEDVKKEAVALKKNATKEELANLDFAQLDPNHKSSCIYGQMTGDCTYSRACELILQCCKRYVTIGDFDDALLKEAFPKMKKLINGRKIEGVRTSADFQNTRGWIIQHFSSIEAYILSPTAKNKNLIDFLKGNRKDLVL